jgi:hypothetical protein
MRRVFAQHGDGQNGNPSLQMPAPIVRSPGQFGRDGSRNSTDARGLELVAAGFEKWKSGTGGKAEFMKEIIGSFNARMSSPLVPSPKQEEPRA